MRFFFGEIAASQRNHAEANQRSPQSGNKNALYFLIFAGPGSIYIDNFQQKQTPPPIDLIATATGLIGNRPTQCLGFTQWDRPGPLRNPVSRSTTHSLDLIGFIYFPRPFWPRSHPSHTRPHTQAANSERFAIVCRSHRTAVPTQVNHVDGAGEWCVHDGRAGAFANAGLSPDPLQRRTLPSTVSSPTKKEASSCARISAYSCWCSPC